MSDELTSAPYVDGDFYVYPEHGGLRLPIIRGGDGTEERQDTPVENAAPVDGTPAAEEQPEYTQERARGLHAELTKAQQAMAERDRLIERARQGDAQAAQELGFELHQDEEVPDLGDEEQESYQDPRVDALIQERAQERETAILRDVDAHIDTLLTEANVELPQRFKQAILQEAWLRGGGPSIQPETTQEVFKEWLDEYKTLERTAGDRYIASKRAPHVSKGGTGATEEVLPLDASHRDRVAHMAERLRLGQ